MSQILSNTRECMNGCGRSVVIGRQDRPRLCDECKKKRQAESRLQHYHTNNYGVLPRGHHCRPVKETKKQCRWCGDEFVVRRVGQAYCNKVHQRKMKNLKLKMTNSIKVLSRRIESDHAKVLEYRKKLLELNNVD